MSTETPWREIQHSLLHPQEKLEASLLEWINASAQNKQFWHEIKLAYQLSGELPAEFSPNMQKAWQRVEAQIERKKRRRTLLQIVRQTAASVLLFSLGAGASWLLLRQEPPTQYTEVISPYGHKTEVVLPDSSTVILNGNSTIKYGSNFTKTRQVQLNGEALFDVKHSASARFVVKSADLQVEVFGTKFNFKDYADDALAEVALLKGSVALSGSSCSPAKMRAGEVATFNRKTEELSIYQADLDLIVSWSTDELVIENKPFGEVMKYLERWYGVEIAMSEGLHRHRHLSFKVKTESLPELLSTINLLAPIDYKINGKHVKLSNK